MSTDSSRTVKSAPARDFRQAFCGARQCPPDSFAEAVFWQCIYPRRKWLARILIQVAPSTFESDFAMIKAIGQAHSVAEIRNEIDLHRYYAPPIGSLRRTLKVRVSGKRLVNLAAKVMG